MNEPYSFDKYKRKEEMPNGEIIELHDYKDGDGVSWDSAEDWLAIKRLNLCGCGMPSSNLEFVTALLSLIDESTRTEMKYEEYKKKKDHLFTEYKEEVTEIIYHWLNGLSILEHGSSVYGSWINDEAFFADCCKWLHENKEESNE